MPDEAHVKDELILCRPITPSCERIRPTYEEHSDELATVILETEWKGIPEVKRRISGCYA